MPSSNPPSASALSTFIHSKPSQSSHPPYLHHLALQIQYNLQHQHDWTDLHIHTTSPLSQQPLPRPLISGFPPRRIYVHPDDQVEELKRGVKDGEIEVEREWILPTNLKEQWSLRRFAEVFDAIGVEPPVASEGENSTDRDTTKKIGEQNHGKQRRGGKRLLLATLGDDSTVVYYVVHDGIVKPRQN